MLDGIITPLEFCEEVTSVLNKNKWDFAQELRGEVLQVEPFTYNVFPKNLQAH